jgi:regulatory protein
VVEDVRALALQALGRKERSVAELGAWLRKRGASPEEVDAAVGYLIAIGTLDDARFARRFAEDKRELAGWGNERIRTALLERGIAAEEVEAALGGGDELGRAEALLRSARVGLDDDQARARALGLLIRRGYGSEVAYEAIRRAERVP